MRVPVQAGILFFIFPFVAIGQSRQSTVGVPVRDASGISILQKSLQTMTGGASISSMTLTGTISVTLGSDAKTGSIRILARNGDQVSEQTNLGSGSQTETYSKGLGLITSSDNLGPMPAQTAFSALPPDVPVLLLSSVLADSDVTVQIISDDGSDSKTTYHVRTQNTFAGRPAYAQFSKFTISDLWIDSQSFLPTKIRYGAYNETIALPAVIEVVFSDYRKDNGLLLPFAIQKLLDGTEWVSILVQSVSQSDLTDADFVVQ